MSRYTYAGTFLLALLLSAGAFADTKISALPSGATLGGTEAIPMYQAGQCAATGGTCQTSPAAITTYVNANASLPATAITSNTLSVLRLPAFSGDCSTPGGSGVLTCGSNIARTGVDINTSNQVTATHLSAALPVLQGGTGSTTVAQINTLLGTTAAAATGQTANQVFATPNASSGAGSFRALVGADVPAINLSASGNGGVTSNLPLTSLPTQVTSTVLGNVSGSTATPTAVNPLALANMQSAVISAYVVSTANITLSGTQTVDGQTVGAGQTVLVAGETTGSLDGIYISAAGAWARAGNFPTGYVIAQNCDLIVQIGNGTANKGYSYRLSTTGGSITIGTTAQTWSKLNLPAATPSALGVVFISAPGATTVASTSPANVTNDCIGASDTAGSVADIGNAAGQQGPCAVSDAQGHLSLLNALGAPATSVGTLDANASDSRGRVTGLTAATAITITFKSPGWAYAPACGGSDSAASVVGVSAVSTAAVTFSVTALTGSLNYWCW